MRYLAAALVCASVAPAGAVADEQAKARARAAVAVTLTMPQPEAAKPAPAPEVDPNPWRWDDRKGWWRPVTHSVTPGVQPAVGRNHVSGVTAWGSPAALCPPGRG
jgi:anti-sigma factor ChrR (cupin superfamily)